jgi:DNA-binding CsgD family transcriptional regulator
VDAIDGGRADARLQHGEVLSRPRRNDVTETPIVLIDCLPSAAREPLGDLRPGRRHEVRLRGLPGHGQQELVVRASIRVLNAERAAPSGCDPQVMQLVHTCLQGAIRTNGYSAGLLEQCARAALCNALGRYEEASTSARIACEHDDPRVAVWALAELIEASVRSGLLDASRAAVSQLKMTALACAVGCAPGLETRSRALLSDGPAAEPLYRKAIEQLSCADATFHVVRSQLLYGEWLRRENRRVDARVQLRASLDSFLELGFDPFAERARRELAATCETARSRTGRRDTLTAHETTIARLAGLGFTNREIGAELFISPRTVEWHLRKVFDKLGIASRRQLRERSPVIELSALAAHPSRRRAAPPGPGAIRSDGEPGDELRSRPARRQAGSPAGLITTR